LSKALEQRRRGRSAFAHSEAQSHIVNEEEEPFSEIGGAPQLVLDGTEQGNCLELQDTFGPRSPGRQKDFPTIGAMNGLGHFAEIMGGFSNFLSKFRIFAKRGVASQSVPTSLCTTLGFVAPSFRHTAESLDNVQRAFLLTCPNREERGITGSDGTAPRSRDVAAEKGENCGNSAQLPND